MVGLLTTTATAAKTTTSTFALSTRLIFIAIKATLGLMLLIVLRVLRKLFKALGLLCSMQLQLLLRKRMGHDLLMLIRDEWMDKLLRLGRQSLLSLG